MGQTCHASQSIEPRERKTGYLLIGKLRARTAAEANRALLA